MDKAVSAKRTADSISKQYRISSPTLDEIIFIIQSYGFEVIDYDRDGRDSAATLISELSLQSFAANGKAFTYQKENLSLMFVCDSLPAGEKRYALAHELGHIACGHLKNSGCTNPDMTEEYEANEFAHYLLSPGGLIKARSWTAHHKPVIWIASIALAAAVIAAPVIYHRAHRQEAPADRVFYVTQFGKKYHLPDCVCIQNRSNVRQLTEEEYREGRYGPCGVCRPDETDK